MTTILDASALLAVLFDEPGRAVVEDAFTDSVGMSSVNLAEVMTRLVRNGMPAEEAVQDMLSLPVQIHDVDQHLALRAGAMFTITRLFGLSLGDRLCLALGEREQAHVLTADRAWLDAGAALGVKVTLIR